MVWGLLGGVGCGPAAQKPSDTVVTSEGGTVSATKRAAAKAERKVLNSGPADVSVTDESGQLMWKISGTSSRVGLDENSGAEAFLSGVQGEFFDQGKRVSTFSAQSAKANTEAKTFKLLKDVVVRSTSYQAELRAEEVEWLEEMQVMAARGQVTVKTDVWTFGPAETIFADKTLTHIGSPDTFKK